MLRLCLVSGIILYLSDGFIISSDVAYDAKQTNDTSVTQDINAKIRVLNKSVKVITEFELNQLTLDEDAQIGSIITKG